MSVARHYAVLVAACLATVAGCDSGPGHAAAHGIIPAPMQVETARGEFLLADGARVAADASSPESRATAEWLIAQLAASRGLELELAADGAPDAEIRLLAQPPAWALPEAYELVSGRDGIEISARDPAGLFYGAVTLWQLATADGAASGAARIPALRIADQPRFQWRGLMLDSARHYQPPEFIKSLIDWMALHKLNVLHWHLTDDQGWRLEIRKHPRLTDVGAWRVPAGAAPLDLYGGYYRQEEVRDIVRHAALRHVQIVPEIEMPGHAQAAIASYPRLGTGSAPAVSADWGVHDQLFNVDEETFRLLEDVLAEVVELFPGSYVHVGGDEAVKDRWKSSPRVQARMRELGVADEEALQGWFVARIERFLDARGRRLIGWDEILEGGVPARATVMSWRGTEGGIEAARGGHDVVMAPAPVLYLDHLQSDSEQEPPGRPLLVTLAEVYAFEPAPPDLTAEQARHVLGAQLNAWTEHMRTPARVAHQAFPRVAALAEATWSPKAARDWNAFLARLPAQFARYRALGIPHATTAFEPRLTLAPADGRRLRVALANQAAFGAIRYTTDGSAPTPESALYEQPFEAAAGTTLRAATFAGELPLAQASAVALTPARLRRRTDETLGQCSGRLVLRLEDDFPRAGPRAVFNVDIIDPCWTWADAELSQGATLLAAVGQVPFNFQIGRDADAIRRGDAQSEAGELEVRRGDCQGEPLARAPLAPAAAHAGVTVLPPIRIPAQSGPPGLCLRFARPAIDPIWTLQWVELRD
jgi:hexosaminidase